MLQILIRQTPDRVGKIPDHSRISGLDGKIISGKKHTFILMIGGTKGNNMLCGPKLAPHLARGRMHVLVF